MNFLENFPVDYNPTSQQEIILKSISQAYVSGYKYVVLNAATGSGKSMIAKAICNAFPEPSDGFKEYVNSGAIYEMEEEDLESLSPEGSSILTLSKSLQDQYGRLFPDDTFILKGKGNYECELLPEMPCDLGPCVFTNGFKTCENCPYYCARNDAVSSKISLYSYSMYLSLPIACRKKKVLICDEASELEDVLVKQYTLPVNFKILKKLGVDIPATPRQGSEYADYVIWIRSLKSAIFDALNSIKAAIKGKKKLKKEQILKYKAIKLYNEHCDKLIDALSLTEFIVEHTADSLEFKPYKVDKIAQKIFKECEFIVFMSATIIDHKNFAKQLGIKSGEYFYVESESTFDPKKAPIKLSDKIYVTYANKNIAVPKLAVIAKQICKHHANQKGIIHTHSLDITKIVHNVFGDDKRFIYREAGNTNELMIEEHADRDDATVLVSPSMTHGIDLIGKLGEFSIVMKAPFLPLGDARIKRLCQEDPDWYLNKMLTNFIQICGRTIRSKKDSAITYVLDATLTNKLLELQDRIPKYILDRFC